MANEPFGESSGISTKILSTRVEVSVKASNLLDADVFSKSDPICVLYIKETEAQNYREFGRTEMIKDDLNPVWMRRFILDYHFEERQFLRFELYDIDNKSANLRRHDPLGYAECILGDLVATMSLKLELKQLQREAARGEIEIQAEELPACKEVATMQLKASQLHNYHRIGRPKPWLEISKLSDQTWIPVYRSKETSGTNVEWPCFTISLLDLCSGEEDRPLQFCIKDGNQRNRNIGEFTTTWMELSKKQSVNTKYELQNKDVKQGRREQNQHAGIIEFANISTESEITFVDFIKAGMKIEVIVSIDFTRSNGDPQDKDSLHYVKTDNNPYSRAIKAVVSILEQYDTDKKIPVYGFGAELLPNEEANMFFPLSGDPEKPDFYQLKGVLEAYKSAFDRITLSGPTKFAPSIEYAASKAEKVQHGQVYTVLLIITDGVICDMRETIKAIIKASILPLSIIIVGVGNENFKAMERLDGDHKKLGYKNKTVERDIVQFVAFRDFDTEGTRHAVTEQELRNEVLRELPYQITSYMKSTNTRPEDVAGGGIEL